MSFRRSPEARAARDTRSVRFGTRVMCAQASVLENADLVSHVLACIHDPNVEVMGRAAASWCAVNRRHCAMLSASSPWPVLIKRVAAQVVPINDSFWAMRVCDHPTDVVFFELCCLARLQRTGVPRSAVRTPFKIFLNGDAQVRWRRILSHYDGGTMLNENQKFPWIVEAWERMDVLEKHIYLDEATANFNALGFEECVTLPGVRKHA